MENSLPFNWDWIWAVVLYSLPVFSVSSAMIIPPLKCLNSPKLGRLPTWLRWVLVLPTALLAGYIANAIPQIFSASIEVAMNRQLTFKPGVDCLIWQAYSPIYFVIGGMKMAPWHRFGTFVTLAGLKIATAIFNLYGFVRFTNAGGDWDSLDPIVNCPLWWNATVSVVCIFILVFLVLYWALILWERGDHAHY